jgi:hypothetical protein
MLIGIMVNGCYHENNREKQSTFFCSVFTERFCDEFVAEAEHHGKWSDGSNNDARLQVHIHEMELDFC